MMLLSGGVWRGSVPNCSHRTAENDFFFILDERSIATLKHSVFPCLSLITTPSSARLSVLITANPSPHWTATHLWRLQRNPAHTHTFLFPQHIFILPFCWSFVYSEKIWLPFVFICLCCCSLLPAAHFQHRPGLLLQCNFPPRKMKCW